MNRAHTVVERHLREKQVESRGTSNVVGLYGVPLCS